jgi:ferredoxin-NADP reductase
MNTVAIRLDSLLNRITMYTLLVYGLLGLLAGAVILSFTSVLHLSGVGIIASAAVLIATCYIANHYLAMLHGTASNFESWLITALILCCILPPETSAHGLALIALGGLLAMAAKYFLVYRHKHLFNPAALAALILGLTSLLPAIWWIGSPSMLVLVLILGVLILRKLHRFQLFLSFLLAAVIVAIFVGLRQHQALSSTVSTLIKSGPLVFLGTVMLTEPATMAPRTWQQRIYGAGVGALFASQLHLGSVSATPELALIVGNIYSFVVSPKYKLHLRLKEQRKIAPQLYDLSFQSDSVIDFRPGQYLEWTLAHSRPDKRGNRRTFSIASAAGASDIHIVFKASEPGSSFKQALLALQPNDIVTAGQLAGNFLLPNDTKQPLVFIAGGIGVTPFVSMISTMINTKEQRDIVLFYIVSSETDYCFQDLWQQAKAVGVRVIPVLGSAAPSSTWRGLSGRLTQETIEHELQDAHTRTYYLSGPNGLVQAYKGMLHGMHVPYARIITDYFSGY